MEFEREIHEQYQKAYALGMKNLQDTQPAAASFYPADSSFQEHMLFDTAHGSLFQIP